MKNLILIALTFASTLAIASGMSVKPAAMNPSCHGTNTGGIELFVTGGALPLTYSWTNGLPGYDSQSHLAAGTYKVTVTDNANNTISTSITLVDPAAISVTVKVTDASANNVSDGSIELNVQGGSPGYSYVWNNSSTNENLWDIAAGNYDVTITDAAGCTTTASNTVHELVVLANKNIVALTQPNTGGSREDKLTLGISDINANETVVYPNPASDHITVKSNNESNTEVRLINIAGQLVYQQKFNSPEINLEVSNIASGNYIMAIQTGQGEINRMVSIAR